MIEKSQPLRVLTIDVEEWFHCDMISGAETWDRYETRLPRNVGVILDALADRGIRGTFFCLGWAAERFPECIREIASAGHEIGCHSFYHRPVHTIDRTAFREDTTKALGTIGDIIGSGVRCYRAPAFSITPESSWALEELIQLGVEVDASVFPASRDYGGWPGFGNDRPVLMRTSSGTIREFPVNTVRVLGRPVVFSGGGYFRLIPYGLLRRWTERSRYLMSYFHPRDFDTGQPVLGHLGLGRRLKSYFGLSGALAKFGRWLDAYHFISVGQAEKLIDWQQVATINVAGTAPIGVATKRTG